MMRPGCAARTASWQRLLLVLGLALLVPAPCAALWHECNAQGVYPGLYGSHAMANLTQFRSRLLGDVWKSFDPEVKTLQGFGRFDPVDAFVSCPPSRPLTQYGRWSLCDLGQLPAPCLVYSVGAGDAFDFENAVVKQTRCEVHTFDCTASPEALQPVDPARHKVHRVCVGDGPPGHKRLGEIARSLGHLRGIDAMRVDLEGDEPGVLAELRHNAPLPRQLVVEFHLRPLPPEETAIRRSAARTPAQLALMFSHLAGLGYGVTQRSDNLGGQTGCCAEFSFLHVEKVWSHGAGRGRTHAPGGDPAASPSGAGAAEAAAPPPAAPRVRRLVVSLASFPGRAQFANPTVYSIMHGKRVPDALYFWVTVNVSRFDASDQEVHGESAIPEEARSLEHQFPGVVKVLAPKKDYGPATKLLPTLEVETEPDTVIVTVDDDTFYHPDTVFDLEQEMIRRPGYTVVRSCEVTHKDPTRDPPRKGWREWKLDEGACRGFMTAYASAAYRREYLDDAVMHHEAGPEGCKHHDDMWFSGHLWVRNVPIWVLRPHVHAWPPMYHRPKNRMSISMHPDADAKGWDCLDYFGWMDDAEVRKRLLGGRQPYKPYDDQP